MTSSLAAPLLGTSKRDVRLRTRRERAREAAANRNRCLSHQFVLPEETEPREEHGHQSGRDELVQPLPAIAFMEPRVRSCEREREGGEGKTSEDRGCEPCAHHEADNK